MTSPADLTHAVLLRVAEFLRKLPADQLTELANGTATLQIAGRPARSGRGSGRTASVAVPVDAEQVRADLSGIDDRAAATRYLNDLKLTVPQLKGLAGQLGISVPGRATKAATIHEIVQWTVGRRLDSAAISRPAPARH